jgi:hypothetical protein
MAKQYATMYDENGVHGTVPRIVEANSVIEAARRLSVQANTVYPYTAPPTNVLTYEVCRTLAQPLGWVELKAAYQTGISFRSLEGAYVVCIFPNFGSTVTLYQTGSKTAPRIFKDVQQGLLGAIFLDPKQMYYNHD